MGKKYVSVKVYRGVLIFASSASFLCGIVLFLAGHPWGGAVALGCSAAASALLFVSTLQFHNPPIVNEEDPEPNADRAKPKKTAKPKQPSDYNIN